MKRKLAVRYVITLLILLMCVVMVLPVKSFATGPMTVYVNGVQVQFSQPPLVEDGNTLVQLRPIYERLGISLDWNEDTQTISGTKDNKKITMTINSTSATVNGKAKKLSIAPKIIDNTTFVPLRFLGESVEGEVVWQENMNRVDIVTIRGLYVYLGARNNEVNRSNIG